MSFPKTTDGGQDPRLQRGMSAQLAERRRRLEAGERSLGWKVGFGTPAAMERLGIDAPLTGFLTDAARIEPGATVSLDGWTRPLLEPEVAVHLAAEVPERSDPDQAWSSVGGIGPAFELADLDLPPEDVEAILAGNVFQRRVMIGPSVPPIPPAELTARLAGGGGGTEIADPQATTGPLPEIVAHMAGRLAAFGERLRAGEVVICGSIVPPLAVSPGEEHTFRLEPCGEVSVRLEA
jgi:2-keto-4-pentenoate hydratase